VQEPLSPPPVPLAVRALTHALSVLPGRAHPAAAVRARSRGRLELSPVRVDLRGRDSPRPGPLSRLGRHPYLPPARPEHAMGDSAAERPLAGVEVGDENRPRNELSGRVADPAVWVSLLSGALCRRDGDQKGDRHHRPGVPGQARLGITHHGLAFAFSGQLGPVIGRMLGERSPQTAVPPRRPHSSMETPGRLESPSSDRLRVIQRLERAIPTRLLHARRRASRWPLDPHLAPPSVICPRRYPDRGQIDRSYCISSTRTTLQALPRSDAAWARRVAPRSSKLTGLLALTIVTPPR
jgi:hypothetical protein